MSVSVPDVRIETWEKLYALAKEIRKLAPWELMYESEIMAFQHPETKEYGFVSVMGTLGEYTALSIYRGEKAFFTYLAFSDDPDEFHPMEIMFARQIQLSFESREAVEDFDRDVMKRLGLRFRGDGNWPIFRSLDYAMLPWALNQDDADFTLVALEQGLHVFERIMQGDHDLLEPPLSTDDYDPDRETVFCRVPVEVDGVIRWEDRFIEFVIPEEKPFKPIIDISAIEEIRSLPKSKMIFQVGMNIMPQPVNSESGRPVFPLVYMAIDRVSDQIIFSEIIEPQVPIENTWQELIPLLMRAIKSAGAIPKMVECSTPLMMNALTPVASVLGFKLIQVEHLDYLDNAVNHLSRFMADPAMELLKELSEQLSQEEIEQILFMMAEDGLSPQELIQAVEDIKRGRGSKR